MISAHWLSAAPLVSAAAHPRTIHDFSGFPATLYQLCYPAPGAPELAHQVLSQLARANLPGAVHLSRGLDHGAWTPLILAYPEANIPVAQLSIQPRRDPQYHWQLGQTLASLRHQGVLIIGSGSATHNLSALNGDYQTPPPDWVEAFDTWLATTIAQADWRSLLNYRHLAPYATQNHPTEEHLLPLFVALGAGGTAPQGKLLHQSYTYAALSMAAYAFV